MLFIICHHLIVHSLYSAYYPVTAPTFNELLIDASNVAFVFLNAFFVVAVNCYVLISGFYGIKPTFKKLCSLMLMCVFYSLSCYLFYAIINDEFSVRDVLYSFLPFSHTRGLWFVGAYFVLFLIAPLLNAAANYLNEQSIKEWIITLIGLAVITFYLGYMWRTGPNTDGYNVFNFLFLYMIGRFLKQYKSKWEGYKYKCLLIYTVCSVITFLLAIYIAINTNDANKVFIAAWKYNSPFIVVGSIAFFLFFASLRIKSNLVNTLAASTFPVYLIHENTFIRDYLYTYFREHTDGMHYIMVIINILLFAVCIFLLCVLVDRLRMIILPKSFK